MIYYIELDKDKEFLEVHEVKNLHNLSRELKISWGYLNYYLNDYSCESLPYGLPMPYIKNNNKMFVISKYKEIIDNKNRSYVSKEIIDALMFMNQFKTVVATSKLIAEQMAAGNDDIILDIKIERNKEVK